MIIIPLGSNKPLTDATNTKVALEPPYTTNMICIVLLLAFNIQKLRKGDRLENRLKNYDAFSMANDMQNVGE